MKFRVNTDKLDSVFTVPVEIIDKHAKLAGALQLRVILHCFRHMQNGIDSTKIATALAVSNEDVQDALSFWSELGILKSDSPTQPSNAAAAPAVKVAPPVVPKPSRSEIARRGAESPEIAFLLQEAQQKFGRMLKQSESAVLVWLYDDMGMDASLILMVIEYAMRAGRCNIGYIERVGRDWAENGVVSISDAEKRIQELNNLRSAWNVMRSAFGLDMRAPSDAESKLAKQCVLDWKISREVMKQAYDACIDSIGKYKLAYIKTVLNDWHKNGVQSVEDLQKLQTAEQPQQKKAGAKKDGQYYAAYDLSLMDKIIDGD